MDKNFILYGHGGSYNHGAEAIVRCTVDMLRDNYPDSKICLSTHFKAQDMEFNLPVDKYIEADKTMDMTQPKDYVFYKQYYSALLNAIDKDAVCLSVGGDNYCYDGWRRWNPILDKCKETGAKNILWACSIEPLMLTGEMCAELKKFTHITTRESLTHDALLEKGISSIPVMDSAFSLRRSECVAINLSMLVFRRNEKIFESIKTLAVFILENTDFDILLLPHVVMPMDNDYEILKRLHDSFDRTDRIMLIPASYSAAQYKFIVSRCRFGVFARTHAAIAAYSSGVPAISIAYSVKAAGIAHDLGMAGYNIQLDDAAESGNLIKLFTKMMADENKLAAALKEKTKFIKAQNSLCGILC
jgi:polysaccharide pyruvyl transferase WcaK-like protein